MHDYTLAAVCQMVRPNTVYFLVTPTERRSLAAARPPQVYSVPPATAPQVVQAQPSEYCSNMCLECSLHTLSPSESVGIGYT